MFEISVICLCITAFLAYINHRWIGLPGTIGVMQLPKGAWKVLTWGGLRGGISVALALSLPAGPSRDVILALTYGVVIFSMLCQGLTIGWVIESSLKSKNK